MVEKIKKQEEKKDACARQVIPIAPIKRKPALRVAAYCRVSTNLFDQDGSIEIQQEHFRQMIQEHPEWAFVGIYEERVSGTHIETRKELGRLLDACRKGKIDLVLCKSVSRLARNVTDLLTIMRELVRLGVDIRFDKEGIDTRNGNGELILTLYATVAEEEVHSISANNRWAIQKRFQDGSYKFPSSPYGYDLFDGGFAVNPREAEIVRKVFSAYLDGKGLGSIAAGMNKAGVPLKRHGQNWKKYNGIWTNAGVAKILKNDTYLGNSLLQKSYFDHNFRLQKNEGAYPQYLWEEHHTALVDEETFRKAGALLDLRKAESHAEHGKEKALFSGKLICGECGSTLYRETDHRKSALRIYWSCPRQRRDKGTCSMKRVLQNDVENAFVTVLNKLHFADVILLLFRKEVVDGWRRKQGSALTELEEKIEETQKAYDRLIPSRDQLVFSMQRDLEWKLRMLQDRYRNMDPPDLAPIDDLYGFVKDWTGEKGGWEQEGPLGKAFAQYIDHVEVLSLQRFRFVFTCGFAVTEGRG